MNNKETVWLYVSGDEYASMFFKQNFDEKIICKEMIDNKINKKTIELDETTIEVEILKFGEVDSKFEYFIKNNLCDSDILKHKSIYKIELEDNYNEDDTVIKKKTKNLLSSSSKKSYPLERGYWQEVFCKFLDDIGLDGYGYLNDEKLKKYKTDKGGFENDIFLVNPYYEGKDKNIMKEHNFVYKPMSYEIDWYRYPLRDSYANKELTFKDFKEILNKCKESIEE